MIEFDGVTKRFDGAVTAVAGLDLPVQPGELTVLVGPSGCGKTTCLRMINRLEEPTGGVVRVHGRDVMDQEPIGLRRGIGYVMQSPGLFPHRRVRDNIATVPQLLGWSPGAIADRVAELAELLGLDDGLLARYPHALSGGEQQRASVARALAADPNILLMDEPFGAVDPVVRTHLQDELVRLQRRLHKTILFVTHDMDEALRIGDRIAVLQRAAQVAQYAPPTELLARPASPFVADFLGAERELRRLALIRAGDVATEPWPSVRSPESAIGDGSLTAPWLVLVDADARPRGWLPAPGVGRGAREADAQPLSLPYTVGPEDSLRTALNAIVASPVGAAPVVDPAGCYTGVLTHASLNAYLQ